MADTALGREMKDFTDSGRLFPLEVVLDMVKPHLQVESWILSGLPRTWAQAEDLDTALETQSAGLDLAIMLRAPDEELLRRLAERWQSQSTGNIYHGTQPKEDAGPFIKRSDDSPESIQRRLAIYHTQTEPLREYYAQRNCLLELDASHSISAITNAIIQAIQRRWLWPPANKVDVIV